MNKIQTFIYNIRWDIIINSSVTNYLIVFQNVTSVVFAISYKQCWPLFFWSLFVLIFAIIKKKWCSLKVDKDCFVVADRMLAEVAVAVFCLKVVRYCMYMWLPMYLLNAVSMWERERERVHVPTKCCEYVCEREIENERGGGGNFHNRIT